MCGFAGVYNCDGSSLEPGVVREMTRLQRHRGPDATGLAFFSLRSGRGRPGSQGAAGGEGLEGGVGVNRLRIQDPTRGADQPFWSPDRKSFVAFNGEIYNAADHRRRLSAEGYRFRTGSDTEVVLQLCRRLGFRQALEQLEGMFALLMGNLVDRRLYLARDRLGIKPLYWYRAAGGTLLFASEIKSFLGHPGFQAELDPERLDEFLIFRSTVGSEGLLRGVRMLQPGRWLEVGPEGVAERSYWEIPRRSRNGSRARSSPARLEQELKAGIDRHLVGDAPIGCQLSGGVDSSLIALLAGRARQGDLDAYSVLFDDPLHSEEPWVRHALEVSGLRGFSTRLDGPFVAANLERAAWHLDLPPTHSNSLGLLRLAGQARRRVTVLLSGEGADELLAGYTRLLYARLLTPIRLALPWIGRWPGLGGKLRDRFGPALRDPTGWYLLEAAFFPPAALARVRPRVDLEQALERRRALLERQPGDFFERCQRYEMQSYLPDLLVRQDKMCMAESLETRVPYLDDRFVGYCLSLPAGDLASAPLSLAGFRSRGTKVLLKKVARRAFGDRFAYRPKRGFSMPLGTFLRDQGLRARVREELLPGIRRRGLLEAGPLESWWRSVEAGDDSPAEALWISLAVEWWARVFLDGRGRPDGPAPRRAEGAVS